MPAHARLGEAIVNKVATAAKVAAEATLATRTVAVPRRAKVPVALVGSMFLFTTQWGYIPTLCFLGNLSSEDTAWVYNHIGST